MKRWAILTVASLVFAIAGRSAMAEATAAMASETFSMPFELVDNRILIDVRLNGKGPYRFILDSGGYGQVSTGVARELGLALQGEEQGIGAGQAVVRASRATIGDMRIGELRIRQQDVGVFSYADLRHVFAAERVD